jgi:hypothetical protein
MRTILAPSVGDIVYTLPNLNNGLNHKVRLCFFNNGNITVRVVPLPALNHESGLYLDSATLSGLKITAQ